jgi:cell division protein FtsN
MEKKQRFFIYDRKEVGVLMLLGVMVAVFAFTLGVHLGKRVTGKGAPAGHTAPTSGVSPVAEVPSTAETEQAMVQPTAVPSAMVAASEDALNQATHDEVTRTGIKLEDTRQLELPEKTKSKNAGATSIAPHGAPRGAPHGESHGQPQVQPTEEHPAATHEPAPTVHKHVEAKHAEPKHAEPKNTEEGEVTASESENPQQEEALAELKALNEKAQHATSQKSTSHKAASHEATGRYTLQIGSFSNEKEAQDRVKDLEISGLSARIHATDLKSKGRWYRIYLGGFPTKAAAEKAGKKYRTQGVIDSFIVAKSVE